MGTGRNELRGIGRAGLWVGAFGWLIGLVLVTLPDTLAFMGPLVGGAAITAACALGLEALWRNAPRPELAIGGGCACAVAVISAYYVWVVEPSVASVPGLVERLAGFGAQIDMPGSWVAVSLLISAPNLLAGHHRREQDKEE